MVVCELIDNLKPKWNIVCSGPGFDHAHLGLHCSIFTASYSGHREWRGNWAGNEACIHTHVGISHVTIATTGSIFYTARFL